MSSDNYATEKRAFRYFSIAFLINFIFGIISIVFTFSFFGIFITQAMVPPSNDFQSLWLIMIPILIIGIIGNILFVYYLWHGFDSMERVFPDIHSSKIGTLLLLLSIFTYPLFMPFYFHAFNPMSSQNLGGIAVILSIGIILSIIAFIGIILVVIGLYKIGEKYESTMIKVGAILLIFLGIIAAILLYIGFKELEHKPFEEKAIVLPPQPPW